MCWVIVRDVYENGSVDAAVKLPVDILVLYGARRRGLSFKSLETDISTPRRYSSEMGYLGLPRQFTQQCCQCLQIGLRDRTESAIRTQPEGARLIALRVNAIAMTAARHTAPAKTYEWAISFVEAYACHRVLLRLLG